MILVRFLLSAFFGLLLGLAILLVGCHWWLHEHFFTALWVLLIGLPAVSGLLGIFFFHKVTALLRESVEEICQRPWWYR
jgi:hypothetical protein